MTPPTDLCGVNVRTGAAGRARLSALLGAVTTALVVACSDTSGPKVQVTVTAVIPYQGLTMGGTHVSILGTNFPTTVDSVRLGAGKLTSLERVSSSEITGTTAASGVAGTVDVTVYTAGAGAATCSACFRYVGLPLGNYRFTAGVYDHVVEIFVPLFYANVAITIQHDSEFSGSYTVTDSSSSVGESFPLSGWESFEGVQFAAQLGDTVMSCYGYYDSLGVKGSWIRYYPNCPQPSRCALNGIFTLARSADNSLGSR
jgi:hypothetical protein